MAVLGPVTSAHVDDDWMIPTEDSWSSSGSGVVLYVGKISGFLEQAGVRFALPGMIPDGSTISTATLTLHGNGDTAAVPVYVYVVDSSDSPQITSYAARPAFMGGSTATLPNTQEGAGSVSKTPWAGDGVAVEIEVGTLVQSLVDKYSGLASAAHIQFILISASSVTDNTEVGFSNYEHTTASLRPTLSITYSATVSAELSGTVTGSIGEADIVAGGKTIILTLTNDTYIAAAGTPTYSTGTTAGTTAADSAGGGGGSTNNGTLTCTFPSSYTPTAGHFALMIVYLDQGTCSTPTDWTSITGNPFGAGTERLYIFTKVLAGGESSPSMTISGSATNAANCANMAIYTGVGSVGAIGTASNGTGTPMTAGGITTTANNSIVCMCCGRGDNETAGSQTFNASATGVTERLDGGTAAGSDAQVSMADKSYPTSGTATGNGSSTTSITDPWVAVMVELTPSTPFNNQRQAIINGLDSAQSGVAGWDAVVKAGQGVTGVVRTSGTVCTITLDAFASYNTTAQETITATIPATALTGASQVVASPTFTISSDGSGPATRRRNAWIAKLLHPFLPIAALCLQNKVTSRRRLFLP